MVEHPHRYLRHSLLPLLLFSLSLLPLQSQHTVRATFFSTPPKIDGWATDAIWSEAEPVTRMTQREPRTGEPFSLNTEVRIGYDKLNLYVAFRCYGDPGEIVAKEMARDVSLLYDDRVQLILDTYLDGRNAYWFQVGPRGSIGDAIISENGAAFNKAWDGLWEGKAQIHPEGWDVEMAIPFMTLGFRKEQDTWGLKLIRYFKKGEETGYWPVANLDAHKFQVSDAGRLTGLEGMSQGIGLDLVPYLLGGADYQREKGGTEPMADAGFEAYYNITPNMKAALTVNTDFAQTEVDDRQINLTRFNLFYPEKRDFFLDGANYFNFGINGDRENPWNTRLIPFFSRRIGLDSLGNPIPVQAGGKVTGQAGRWNIGAMYMKDRRVGWTHNHFLVGRVSRNLGEQSQAGLIATYGNALADRPNLLVGGDFRLATSRFRGNKNMSLTFYGFKSSGTSPPPDSPGTGRDLAWGAEFAYPNDLVHFRLGHLRIQEDFEAGLGYVPRPGIRETYGEFLVGPRPSRWGILQVQAGVAGDHISDFRGRLLTREWTGTPLLIRFLSGDEITYRVTSAFESLNEPFAIYEGHVIPRGQYAFLWHQAGFRTAGRRRAWTQADYRWGGFFAGSRREIAWKAGFQVAVPFFLGGEWIRNDIHLGEEGFIATIYRVNANLLISPDITLYTFVQYDNQSGELGWQSRFQWILKPGREVFLVWNSRAENHLERFSHEEAGMRLKIKYTIRF